MGKRRKSRELTLQLLYQYEMTREAPQSLLPKFWEGRKKLHEDIRSFTEALFKGTLEHLDGIDPVIAELSQNWKLSRISRVDKNIIRFAIYEICFRDDIPEKVSVDEAIEVAKRYSSDDAGAFINGILDGFLQNKEEYLRKVTAAPSS